MGRKLMALNDLGDLLDHLGWEWKDTDEWSALYDGNVHVSDDVVNLLGEALRSVDGSWHWSVAESIGTGPPAIWIGGSERVRADAQRLLLISLALLRWLPTLDGWDVNLDDGGQLAIARGDRLVTDVYVDARGEWCVRHHHSKRRGSGFDHSIHPSRVRALESGLIHAARVALGRPRRRGSKRPPEPLDVAALEAAREEMGRW